MKWLGLLILLLAASQGCNTKMQVSAQEPCGFVQNSDGQRVSLKNGMPLKLYFDNNFPTQYYADVTAAIATWQAALGKTYFIVQNSPLPASTPAQDGVSVIYWLSNWDESQKTQQANTTIYWEGTTIVEADLKFDASYFSMSDNPGPTDVDMQSLVLHELGHALGLKHDDLDQSVMATYLSADFERRALYTSDLQHVQCEY